MTEREARPVFGFTLSLTVTALVALGAGFGCGRSPVAGRPGSAAGGRDDGGAMGTGGSSGGTGGVALDPAQTATWDWKPCGTLAPAPADVATVMSPDGKSVAVLDEGHGVRVHPLLDPGHVEAVGTADFLVYASDSTLYLGTVEALAGGSQSFLLQPTRAGVPSLRFEPPRGVSCGFAAAAFSGDGVRFMVNDGPAQQGHTCVWNKARQEWLGTLDGGQAFRGSNVVSLGCDGGFHITTRSPDGTVLSTVVLESAPHYCPSVARISPTGDRVATTVPGSATDIESARAVLWDAESGKRLASVSSERWIAAGGPDSVFSPSGDRVFLGDSIVSTKDGSRLADAGIPWEVSGPLVLSPDGRTAVSRPKYVDTDRSRATLIGVADKRTVQLLGAPPRSILAGRQAISDLALSANGNLLLFQIFAESAFAVRVAPRFADSAVLWPMRSDLGMAVDVDAAGVLATATGDVRTLYRVADGHMLWDSIPPPGMDASQPCAAPQLRLSPSGRWAAGAGYVGGMEVFPTASATPWTRLVGLPSGCQDKAVFSPDERLMATSVPALYRTGDRADDWETLWSKEPALLPRSSDDYTFDQWGQEVRFSPDLTKLLVSRCQKWTCQARLYAVADGAELADLPALTSPHPSFSPEGHWLVAGGTLLHLPSGTVRSLDPAGNTAVAIFTPNGDIIGGSSDQTLTRYCRSP